MTKELNQLREIINEFQETENPYSDKLQKCIELIDDIDADRQELVDEVDSLESELNDANTEITNLQEGEAEYKNSIDLGLDTIHFTFEKGNLQIRQQFDTLMQLLCKTPNALI